jgi:uncharacterized integral membrane protein
MKQFIKEARQRWATESPDFFNGIIEKSAYMIVAIGATYATLAGLESTGYYTTPEWLKEALKTFVTICVSAGLVAKLAVKNPDKLDK